MEPLAIVGFAFDLPQGVVSEESFWELLQNRKTTTTDWPETRAIIDSVLNEDMPLNTLGHRRGNFLESNPYEFDAPFFSMSPSEAAALDPQTRLALETSYHAFENAGLSSHSLKGSQTAVIGSLNPSDFSDMVTMDPDTMSRFAGMGLGSWSLPNRISWFFGLQGPSLTVDTACSSSLTAFDVACKMIQSGDASTVSCALQVDRFNYKLLI